MNHLRVHGSIFFLLRKFVIHSFSIAHWSEILGIAGLSGEVFDIHQNYPLENLNSIIDSASELSGIKVFDLKEKFGEYMVPDLFVMYHSYLNPNWKTFDVLENTEKVMHGAVRSMNSSASPPVLHVNRVNENLIIIDYHSKRKMGSLAIGIIKGIALFYNESTEISVIPVTDPDDERMQIKVIKS